MKLLTIERENEYKLAVQTEQGIIDISATIERSDIMNSNLDIPSILACKMEHIEPLQEFVQTVLASQRAVFVEESDICWGPSVSRPHKIICVGLNYRKHADETGSPYPDVPILFNKFDNTLAGHKAEIPIPSVTDKLDYEVELGIVIGKRAKNVDKKNALNHVFGYCTANDLSARDLQMKTHQWLLGKSCDKFSPIGPFIVTSDEIENPNNLALKTYVNGEIRQDSTTADMIFSCAEIISYISRHMTLEPGDLILTGTPEGVVFGYPEHQQNYIQPGDVVTVEIDKLGALTNYFVAEE